jgi:hypothetical protein
MLLHGVAVGLSALLFLSNTGRAFGVGAIIVLLLLQHQWTTYAALDFSAEAFVAMDPVLNKIASHPLYAIVRADILAFIDIYARLLVVPSPGDPGSNATAFQTMVELRDAILLSMTHMDVENGYTPPEFARLRTHLETYIRNVGAAYEYTDVAPWKKYPL